VNANSSGRLTTSKFYICSNHLPLSICYKRTDSPSGSTNFISTISSNVHYPIWTMTTRFGYNFPLSFQLLSFLIPYVLNIGHKQPSQINIFLNETVFVCSLAKTAHLVHKYSYYYYYHYLIQLSGYLLRRRHISTSTIYKLDIHISVHLDII